MEGLIVALNAFCVAWLCWKLYKADERPEQPPDLGIFSYDQPQDR